MRVTPSKPKIGRQPARQRSRELVCWVYAHSTPLYGAQALFPAEIFACYPTILPAQFPPLILLPANNLLSVPMFALRPVGTTEVPAGARHTRRFGSNTAAESGESPTSVAPYFTFLST